MRHRSVLSSIGGLVIAASLATPASAVIQNYTARIDNKQEQAAGNCLVGSASRGSASMTFDTVTNNFTWNITFGTNAPDHNNGLLSQGAENNAHFHIGAPGVNGAVTIGLPLGNPKIGGQVLTAPQVTALTAGNLYINIHSVGCAAGEIRGQVLISQVPLMPVWAWLLAAAGIAGSSIVLLRNWRPRRAAV